MQSLITSNELVKDIKLSEIQYMQDRRCIFLGQQKPVSLFGRYQYAILKEELLP